MKEKRVRFFINEYKDELDTTYLNKVLLNDELMEELSKLDNEKMFTGLKIAQLKADFSYKLKALKYLEKLENNFLTFEASLLFSNSMLIKNNMVFESVKTLLEIENIKMMNIVFGVLTNELAVKQGISTSAAKIIGTFDNSINAEIASLLFKNKTMLSKETIFDALLMIKNATDKVKAKKIYELYTNIDIKKYVDKEYLRKASILINTSTNEYNTIYVYDVLTFLPGIKNKVSLKGAELIKNISEENKVEAAMLAQMLCTSKLVKNTEILEEVKRVLQNIEKDKLIKKNKPL